MSQFVSIFNQLRQRVLDAGGLPTAERKAMYWLNRRRHELTAWQRTVESRNPKLAHLYRWKFVKEIVPINALEVGKLYFYGYDAKHKDTLPYWDALPLCLPIEYYEDGFLGLNLHYLNYRMRAILFDGLSELQVYKHKDFQARIKANYRFLKQTSNLRYFKPCVHRYLYSHVLRGEAIHIGSSEWTIALFLPVDAFQKKTRDVVWAESAKKLRG